MHMMQMLGALSLVFFIGLFLLCYFREKLNNPIINPLFIIVCAICFFCWNYAAYERGWLDDGFMTLENISPFICTIILLTPFMSEKIKDFAYCAIAFLGFGMFLALYISPGASYFMSHNYTATFMHISEAVCHLAMSLYGFYLILSNKVTLSWQSLAKSIVFIYTAIGFGVFLNWCFHLGNFGMDMYGDYSIYFLDIFGSFEATFVAYLVGVLAVIAMGFLVGMFLDWLSTPKNSETVQTDPTAPGAATSTEEEQSIDTTKE